MHVTVRCKPYGNHPIHPYYINNASGKRTKSFMIPYPIIAKYSIVSPQHHRVKIILSERRNETWILVVLILVVMETLPAGFTSDRSP